MDFKDVELIKLEKRELDIWWNSMLEIPLIYAWKWVEAD